MNGTPDTPLLEIKHISKSFIKGKPIIKDFSLNINKGDKIVIIGPSGSGKSTVLRCINQLNTVDGGEIYFDGKLITSPDKSLHEPGFNVSKFKKENSMNINQARAKIGMVFQHFNLFNNLSVINNLILAPVQLKLMSKTEAIEKAESLLDRIGLFDKRDAYPSTLSGGQKQRIAIIRSLMVDPEIILFDEATSALDPEMVKEVLNLMQDLADQGMTMVIVTHMMNFARQIASKLLFMQDGEIVETGDANELFNNPKTEELKHFLSLI